MSPTPPLDLVQALARFDRRLRIKWATHQRHWAIEVQARERQPGWLAEKPSPLGTTPRAKDAWDSWREGWLFVTKLPHPIPYPIDFILSHLKHLSLEAHQAKDELIRRLDAAEAEEEAAIKRAWDVGNEAAAKATYDALQWSNKRAISTYVAGPNQHLVQHDGFVVFDRRPCAAQDANAQ